MQITFVAGADNATLPLAAIHDPRQVARPRETRACVQADTHARTHADLDLDRASAASLSLPPSLDIDGIAGLISLDGDMQISKHTLLDMCAICVQ